MLGYLQSDGLSHRLRNNCLPLQNVGQCPLLLIPGLSPVELGERGQEGEMLTGALAHWISCSPSILPCSLSSPSTQTGNSDAYKFRANSL